MPKQHNKLEFRTKFKISIVIEYPIDLLLLLEKEADLFLSESLNTFQKNKIAKMFPIGVR